MIPRHWTLRGPQRHAVAATRVFRFVNAGGRHMATLRRLFAVGPWTVYVGRYKPGQVDEAEETTGPTNTQHRH